MDNKANQVCLFIGRFQPFTLGHLKCCETVYKTRKLKSVILIINTTKADKKHPFLTKDIINTYKKMAHDYECIEDVLLVSNADIVKNVTECREHGYEPVAWVCGTDRVNDYKRMVDKYSEKLDLVPNFDVFEIPRTDDDISATKCREALIADDYKKFSSMVPPEVAGMYYKLRKMIEDIK